LRHERELLVFFRARACKCDDREWRVGIFEKPLTDLPEPAIGAAIDGVEMIAGLHAHGFWPAEEIQSVQPLLHFLSVFNETQ